MHPHPSIDDAIIELLHISKHTKRSDLRHHLIARGFVLTDRELRKHIETLIMEKQFCIQSSERGYSLITSSEDLSDAKKYLNKKAMSLLSRCKQLEMNYAIGRLANQLDMFL